MLDSLFEKKIAFFPTVINSKNAKKTLAITDKSF